MAWGMRNVKIAIFGSSIMEGRIGVDHASERYYSILQRQLSERFPEVCFAFFNGAIGGRSTRELMEEFDGLVLKYAPDYCLVMFGANNDDLCRPERSLADGEFETLMEDFQRRLPANCCRIGVVLNPVIDELHQFSRLPEWQEVLRSNGGLNKMLEKERDKARNFYRKYNYPVIDLAKLMAADPHRYICSDGIHLSPDGHQLFAGSLFEVLKKLLHGNNHDTNGR